MRALLVTLSLMLSACAPNSTSAPAPQAQGVAWPSWENARAAGVDFRAVGQEPGWLLDIYQQERIALQWDYMEREAVFPLPAPSYPVEGATRYDTHANGRTLSVTIRRFPCNDAMSGAPYPATVEVTIDGRTLRGCGRSV